MTTLFGEQINTLNSEKIFYHLENGQYSAVSDVELIYSIVGNEELAGRIYQTAGKDWASLFKYSAAELLKMGYRTGCSYGNGKTKNDKHPRKEKKYHY